VNVGQINFGPAAEAGIESLKIRSLESQIADLTSQRKMLRRVLQSCAALTPAVSSAKHEALLMTDPKNLDLPIEKPLP
jgi:hypothetical protein